MTCFCTFTALHWKRDVSKGPFQFILETSYQSISSIGVSAAYKRAGKAVAPSNWRQKSAAETRMTLTLTDFFAPIPTARELKLPKVYYLLVLFSCQKLPLLSSYTPSSRDSLIMLSDRSSVKLFLNLFYT